ncbi:DUF2184 domain-containing protein [Sphingomonas abaci]|uniref:DUF2184 domain-containing protein n=1 Tax=Sphingomonas abaci TaxID=237611 RepID=A0A7W7AHF8_9SPHN|nr:DUF2184 domain-containing protein [Sphingomonas abaci]MBB4616916.1 hypothetical protein [Sphingomonas abaci]
MRTDFNDARQALGFLTPQLYNIERQVYEIRYPSFDYASLVPVITEGNPWGRGTVFYTADAAGEAQFLSGKGFDGPYADIARSQYLKRFELAGTGYEWTLEELETAAIEGRDLGADKAAAARKIAEQFLFYIAMNGRTPQQQQSSEKNWTGLLNDPNVTAVTAAGAFTARTPDQILAEINNALSAVHTSTQEIETADTVLLPFAAYQYVATTPRATGSDKTILSFLQENNVYSSETGQPLTIRSQRLLTNAGAGSATRMVVYNRNPDVVRFHLPMPFQFKPAFQKSSMTWEVLGLFRTGGTEVRRPAAMRYVDGV